MFDGRDDDCFQRFSFVAVAARIVDAGLVARLGAAADAALKAGSPVNLAEMCSLKAPSPAARRLILGLVVALGLR